MEFLDKLSDDQAKIGLMVAERAKKMGIDPKLAVALAFQESSLDPNKVSSAGATGVMQVKPTTAEMLGYSEKDLQDTGKNIDIGLQYLKQGLDKFEDPMLAIAGYHAGMDHKFFTEPDKNPLPPQTTAHVKKVQQLGGFSSLDRPKETEDQSAAERERLEASSRSIEDERIRRLDEEFRKKQAESEAFQAMKLRGGADVLGAGAGALAAKGLQTGKDVVGGARAMVDFARQASQGGLPGGGLVAGRPPLPGDASSGAKWLQNWGNIQKPGFTGGVPEAADVVNKMKPRSPILQKLQKQGLYRPTPVQPGVFTGGQLSISSRVPQPPPMGGVPAAQPAGPGALSKVAGGVRAGMGALTQSPIASGALGGLSAAESAQEFQKRYQAKDIPGMVASGVGAAGGLLSMVPHPATRGVGMAMSAASPLALYLLDKSRARTPARQSYPIDPILQQMAAP